MGSEPKVPFSGLRTVRYTPSPRNATQAELDRAWFEAYATVEYIKAHPFTAGELANGQMDFRTRRLAFNA